MTNVLCNPCVGNFTAEVLIKPYKGQWTNDSTKPEEERLPHSHCGSNQKSVRKGMRPLGRATHGHWPHRERPAEHCHGKDITDNLSFNHSIYRFFVSSPATLVHAQLAGSALTGNLVSSQYTEIQFPSQCQELQPNSHKQCIGEFGL